MNAVKVSVDVEQLKAFNSQLKSINMKGVGVSVDVWVVKAVQISAEVEVLKTVETDWDFNFFQHFQFNCYYYFFQCSKCHFNSKNWQVRVKRVKSKKEQARWILT